MSTEASDIDVSRTATPSPAPSSTAPAPETQPATPKRITNAQTVCNEKNARGKGCWGHLKQLRTAGQPAAVHLRGDDVLFKCQNCGTLYMGPPLGHVRDPEKQRRFVQDELTALLQAAGGTLPIVRKDERGVYVLVEPGGEPGPASARQVPAAPKPVAGASTGAPPAAAAEPATAPVAAAAAKPAPPVAAKAVAPAATAAAPAPSKPRKAGEPNRQLMKRSTYGGVVDTGPLPGETHEQKIERLKKLAAAAKQHAEEGGPPVHSAAPAEPPATSVEVAQAQIAQSVQLPAPEPEAAKEPLGSAVTTGATPASAPEIARPASESPASMAAAGSRTAGQPDLALMKRSTYAGVADTGPIAGETRQQKIERLTKLVAAAKQRAEEGG